MNSNLSITPVNNNKKSNIKKYAVTSAISWFILDMGVGSVSDVYHNSKSTKKLAKPERLKQCGKNALWAGVTACVFAPAMGKLYDSAKKGQKIEDENTITIAGFVALCSMMLFRLYVASRPHPKWKGALSKFWDLF